jgi:hypothetical protein
MARVIPSARLIYLLRDPIERMRASYLHSVSVGEESLPIDQALIGRGHYTATSSYALQIDQYLRHFDRSQLLVVLTEDLERAPEQTFDTILSFLGLSPGWRPPDLGVRHHPTSVKRVPRPWARRLGGLMIRARIPAFRGRGRDAIRNSPLLTREMTPADTTLSDDVRERLAEVLRPDVERLREHLGSGFEGWGLLT